MNPFDWPKQIVAHPPQINANRRKVENFRQDLNKQLFGNHIDDQDDIFQTKNEVANERGNRFDTQQNQTDSNPIFTKIESKITPKKIQPAPTINSPIIPHKKDNPTPIESLPLANQNIDSNLDNNPSFENNPRLIADHDTKITNIEDNITNNNMNAGLGLTSSELFHKLDKLKKEIRDLKQSKSTLESNYQLACNKNKIYEKEIEELRKDLGQFKKREIKEGPESMKLEIQSLKNSLEYRRRENELLKKENESLHIENKKLQEYLKKFKLESKYQQKEENVSKIDNRDFVQDNVEVLDDKEEYDTKVEPNVDRRRIYTDEKTFKDEEPENKLVIDEKRNMNILNLADVKNISINSQKVEESPQDIFINKKPPTKPSPKLPQQRLPPVSAPKVAAPKTITMTKGVDKNPFEDVEDNAEDIFSVSHSSNKPMSIQNKSPQMNINYNSSPLSKKVIHNTI